MSLNDLKIPNYERDIKMFEFEINNLKSEKGKKLCNDILEQIKQQMDIIKRGHSSYNGGFLNPQFVRENVNTLCSLRNKLKKLISQSKRT